MGANGLIRMAATSQMGKSSGRRLIYPLRSLVLSKGEGSSVGVAAST
jgi:hypothetical protein